MGTRRPRHWACGVYRRAPLALFGALLAALALLPLPGTAAPGGGTVITPPRPIANLSLIDQHGARVTTDTLAGRWTVLFFGFTHCPDVCPTTLARLAGVQRRLPEALRPKVRFMLVSVDPMRDTPQRLAQYVGQFGQDFVGATAPLGELAPLLRELGVSYAYTAQPAGEHAGHGAHADHGTPAYTVTHSETLYVLDPQARFYAVFTDPKDDYALLRDLSTWANQP
jgi:protein SCO1/2